MPKVYLAADHAGFQLKEALKARLAGHALEDCGAYELVEGDDYPDMVRACAEKVAADTGSFGIVVGASGEGEAMAANRVPGVRAAVYYGEAGKQTDADGNELTLLKSARAHNDANVLSLGARFLTEDQALAAAESFLSAAFSGDERHARRIAKLG